MTADIAYCPNCNEIGYVVALGGWVLRCKSCDIGWGHPQLCSLDEANDAIETAKETKATMG